MSQHVQVQFLSLFITCTIQVVSSPCWDLMHDMCQRCQLWVQGVSGWYKVGSKGGSEEETQCSMAEVEKTMETWI